MSCTECKYAPRTYEEYCIAQSNPGEYCLDAFTGKSSLCKLYTDTKGNYDEDKKKLHKEEYKSRFDEVKEERKDYEFNLVEEKKVAELAILNDTLALIYDYISEKK